MRGRSLYWGLSVVSLLAGCGGGGSDVPSGPTGGGANAVTVGNNFYSPASLSVAVNTTVTWTWANGDVSHSVSFDDGQTSDIQSSGSYQRAFGTAGTFPYHCKVHGAAMSGTVTVTAAGTTTGTGDSGMGGGGGGYGS
jgi:plastocyanin